MPYEFTEFGAIAARRLYVEGKHIPEVLVPPTKKERATYGELYLADSVALSE